MTNDVKRPEAIIREPKHAKLTATHLSRIQNGQIGDTVKAWDITLGKIMQLFSENVEKIAPLTGCWRGSSPGLKKITTETCVFLCRITQGSTFIKVISPD